ncbi:hypothetical protein [Persicobacter diffluens]|uniref:Uncharacterized protein n=1 Tax=Persicobacter diffluens TaxID=981 RepID=A0AAN5ALM3_9BACT|nr:hypothetical protein PEDI_46870 [Persicobacter diffluens]
MKNKLIRFIYPSLIWGLQIITLYYFLLQTNEGNNDAETDAVILLFSLISLFVIAIASIMVMFKFEKQLKFRIVNIILLLIIPTIWIFMIYLYGNPLYRYYIKI